LGANVQKIFDIYKQKEDLQAFFVKISLPHKKMRASRKEGPQIGICSVWNQTICSAT